MGLMGLMSLIGHRDDREAHGQVRLMGLMSSMGRRDDHEALGQVSVVLVKVVGRLLKAIEMMMS
jgi:hypothetical protein